MIFPIQLQVLDFVSRQGKGENPKTYHNLYCYQSGSQYPQLIEVSVDPALVAEAKSLVGQTAVVEVDQYTYNGKSRHSYISHSEVVG